MKPKFVFHFLNIFLLFVLLCIPSDIFATVYKWDDYTKLFDKEIRLTGSVEIEVDLPKEIIETL